MSALESLRVKLFADGADKSTLLAMNELPHIQGMTTNPTLMRKAGVKDYEAFARDVLERVTRKPISFEVLSDDFEEMQAQARLIATWGPNVYAKIPITNTHGVSSRHVVQRLSSDGIRVNVTAIMTLRQVREVVDALDPDAPAYVSVFAGRIADTGRDPVPLVAAALELLHLRAHAELIWASPREVLNVLQADGIGCHIITATADILSRLEHLDRDLADYSLDTVQMFKRDADAAGYVLKTDMA